MPFALYLEVNVSLELYKLISLLCLKTYFIAPTKHGIDRQREFGEICFADAKWVNDCDNMVG